MQFKEKITFNEMDNVGKEDLRIYIEIHIEYIKILYVALLTERIPLRAEYVLWDNDSESQKEAFLKTIMEQADKVYIVVSTSVFYLVPSRFFSQERMDNLMYLSNGPIDIDETCYCDEWASQSLFLVYTVPKYIVNLLKESARVECYHLLTAMDYIIRKKKWEIEQNIYCVILNGRLWVWTSSISKGLIHAQNYDFLNESDVLYFVMQIVQAADWNTEDTCLWLLQNELQPIVVHQEILEHFKTNHNISLNQLAASTSMKNTDQVMPYSLLFLMYSCEK